MKMLEPFALWVGALYSPIGITTMLKLNGGTSKTSVPSALLDFLIVTASDSSSVYNDVPFSFVT